MTKPNAGIDYGLELTNIDHETGIRYGVISQHTVGEAWYEDAEADYGKPSCPICGNEAREFKDYSDGPTIADMENWDRAKYECDNYVCFDCEYVFGSESAYSEEPLGYYVDTDEYKLTDCLDSDIMVIKSPYYTYAQFCSPCVPGACSLDNPLKCGWGDICKHEDDLESCSHRQPKCYCLGHDWFDGGIAPYPVYRVTDDSEVKS